MQHVLWEKNDHFKRLVAEFDGNAVYHRSPIKISILCSVQFQFRISVSVSYFYFLLSFFSHVQIFRFNVLSMPYFVQIMSNWSWSYLVYNLKPACDIHQKPEIPFYLLSSSIYCSSRCVWCERICAYIGVFARAIRIFNGKKDNCTNQQKQPQQNTNIQI